MSIAEPIPSAELKTRPPASPAKRNGRWAGYTHLLMARMKELKREPEVIFWVFVFPLLLAFGLGIAFRNKPADATSVVIVAGPRAQDAVGLLGRSPQPGAFKIEVQDADTALRGFRLGKYDLVIEPDAQGGLQYRYDPARPESVLERDPLPSSRAGCTARTLRPAAISTRGRVRPTAAGPTGRSADRRTSGRCRFR